MKQIALALAASLASLSMAAPVSAQQAGDRVALFLPAETSITTGPDGDEVLLVGRSMASVDTSQCVSDVNGATVFPMRPVIVVDAGPGTRASRSDSAFILAHDKNGVLVDLRNGTRIGNLAALTVSCFINDVPYIWYEANIK